MQVGIRSSTLKYSVQPTNHAAGKTPLTRYYGRAGTYSGWPLGTPSTAPGGLMALRYLTKMPKYNKGVPIGYTTSMTMLYLCSSRPSQSRAAGALTN